PNWRAAGGCVHAGLRAGAVALCPSLGAEARGPRVSSSGRAAAVSGPLTPGSPLGGRHSLLETGAASLPEVKSQSGLQVSEGWPARDHRMGARALACSEVLSTEEWGRRSRALKRAAVAAVPQPKK
ncbi:hypothetical protein EI555_006670, partial [Monodon monoceros]